MSQLLPSWQMGCGGGQYPSLSRLAPPGHPDGTGGVGQLPSLLR
jgi:hypothetical protein